MAEFSASAPSVPGDVGKYVGELFGVTSGVFA